MKFISGRKVKRIQKRKKEGKKAKA